MKIEMGKKYRTWDGRSVRILATDLRGERPIAVAIGSNNGSEFTMSLHENGRRWMEGESDYDLVEVSLYEGLVIDEPVVATIAGAEYLRHFAGVIENGRPTVFDSGRTKWSSAGRRGLVDSVRRPTKEELK